MAGAISKGFDVLRLLRRTAASMTLTDIARAIKIAPSTAHSILNELTSQGAVVLDGNRRYRIGPAAFYLGCSYVHGLPIHRGAWGSLVEVGRELSLTAVVAVPWNQHHLIVDVNSAGSSDIEVSLGGRVPIDAGAWGKAYFAWSGVAQPARFTAHTAKTVVDPERYRSEIDAARNLGYAKDEEEFIPRAGAVASGITSDSGFEGVIALVGRVGHMNEFDFDEAGRRVAAIASRASYTLGDHSRVRLLGVE